jgi:uncharacterized protein (DUF2062 family)
MSSPEGNDAMPAGTELVGRAALIASVGQRGYVDWTNPDHRLRRLLSEFHRHGRTDLHPVRRRGRPRPLRRPSPRALADGLAVGDLTSWWVYLVGPVVGAFIAVGVARVLRGPAKEQEAVAAMGTPLDRIS